MSRATALLADELAEEAMAEQEKEGQENPYAIKKMTNKAWLIFEVQMSNPGITGQDIAKHTGCTAAFVSRVINSPCYEKEVRRMRNKRILDKLEDVVMSSLKRMDDIVQDEGSDDSDAIEVAKVALTAMGMYGNNAGKNPAIQVNVGAGTPEGHGLGVTAEMVTEARERRKEKIIEGDFVDVEDKPTEKGE